MRRILKSVAAGVALVGLLTSSVHAELREVENGVFVEDFEDGNLDQLGINERERAQETRVPEKLEVVKQDGKAALHLKGGAFHNRVFYLDRKFEDFSLEVRVKKTAGSYAGIVVRDHWRVYFQMRGFLSLNSDLRELNGRGELFKSSERFTGYHTLKVVCAGPLMHVYVDDQPMFSRRITPGEGRLGFYAHGHGEAYYGDLRIGTHVDPVAFLDVQPQAADECLVFSPNENVQLRFQVSNASDSPQSVTVAASVKTWGGEVVKDGERQEVTVAAEGDTTVDFDMGQIPAGFFRLDLHASCAGKQICERDDLPLAIQERGGVPFTAPTIPVAGYCKYYNKRTPLYHNTYAHAIARDMRDHSFNAVVADPSFTRETIDIFQSYGIATIARSSQFLDHPAVIAALVSDEPKADEIDELKQEYAGLRETTDKPLTTCLVGDALGFGKEGGPLWIWNQLKPELRCFRWYGIKKSFYGILHEVKYKPYLPLSTVLRIAEMSSDTPYWIVLPSLGKTEHESYYHAPTPAEIRGMMHLSLAYGADGLLFFAYQSHMAWPCFVDQMSLEPTDGKYAAAAEVAGKINAHAELIKSLEHVGLDIRCPSPVVDAVPRISSKDEKLYVYAVNRDTKNAVSTRLLLWAERWTLTSVQDVFYGKDLEVTQDEEGYLSVAITLKPGEGKLLATDAASRK